MKNYARNILTAAIVAAISLATFGASAAGTTSTPYVFRMPLAGLKGPAACPHGWAVMLPSSGTGSDSIPAGCSTVIFSLVGTNYAYPSGGGYATVTGDEVDGSYAIPGGNAGGTTVSYNWLADGTVVLSVGGVEVAVAAAAGSGDQSQVAHGAVATKLTYAGSVPSGGWLQGNSGIASINAQ